MRRINEPVGLINVYNTKFLNSLLFLYFNTPWVVEAILEFKDDSDLPPLEAVGGQEEAAFRIE